MSLKYENLIFKYIENVKRQLMLRPLSLGATFKGSGGPPGGFIGFLPQSKVSYDTIEAESSGFVSSGAYNSSGILASATLIDNLNHIRHRIATLEDSGSPGNVSVYEDGVLVASGITVLDFTGNLDVSSLGDTATISGTGGGSSNASDIITVTTAFDGNLSSADDTVQKALDTLDDLSFSGSVPTLTAYEVAHANLDGIITSNPTLSYKADEGSLVVGAERQSYDASYNLTVVSEPANGGYGLFQDVYGWGEHYTRFSNGTRDAPLMVEEGDYLTYWNVTGRAFDGAIGFEYYPLVADSWIEALETFSGATGTRIEVKWVFEVSNAGTDAGLTEILTLFGDRIEVDGSILATSATITDINVSTTNFNGVLSAADNTLQKALDTLDNISVSGVGASTFTDLTDVPASYVGAANKLVTVTSTEDGLEFIPTSGIITSISGESAYLIVGNTSHHFDIFDSAGVTGYFLKRDSSHWGLGWYPVTAGGVTVSTINFDGNLSVADNTVQKALDTLDNLAISGSITKKQLLFYVDGVVSTVSGAMRIPNHTGASFTLHGVYLDISTAPTGSSLIVDININGTTIFTDQGDRPTITAGNNTGYSTTITVTGWADNEYLTMDVDQVGSTISGSNLTVTVVYQ